LLGELFSLRWFFLGMEQMKFKAIINFLSTLLYIVLVLVLVQNDTDYIWIPFAEGIALLIVSFISFIWVLKKYKIHLKLITLPKIISYLIENFKVFINLLLPSTFSVIAVFLVGVFGLPSQVSMTQIGVKLSNAFTSINAILTQVFYPMVNRNNRLMFTSRIALLVIGIFLSIVMYTSSDLVINAWLRNEPVSNLKIIIGIVKILSPLPFLVAVISSYGVNGLLTFFKDSLFSYITIIATLAMIISAWILIPIFSFYGGAMALLIGRMVYAVLTFFSFKKIV
jgi:O-antigen/teichoic acid export membrane protein